MQFFTCLKFTFTQSVFSTQYLKKKLLLIISIINVKLFCFRCTPPNKSNDYQKIYSDWCHEFEKYKTAMKSWEKKQAVSEFKLIYYFSLIFYPFFPILSNAPDKISVTNIQMRFITEIITLNYKVRISFILNDRVIGSTII